MGRVRVVSLVAGTEREKERISILGESISVCKGFIHSQAGKGKSV